MKRFSWWIDTIVIYPLDDFLKGGHRGCGAGNNLSVHWQSPLNVYVSIHHTTHIPDPGLSTSSIVCDIQNCAEQQIPSAVHRIRDHTRC